MTNKTFNTSCLGMFGISALAISFMPGCTKSINVDPHPLCHVVEAESGTVPGPEDFDVFYDRNGRAKALIVSAQDRRAADRVSERNGLYWIPLEADGRPGLARRLATPGCHEGDRHYAAKPHGISLVQEDGKPHPTLWVINHQPDCPGAVPNGEATPDVVERYTLDNGRLLAMPDLPRDNRYLRNPNDLVGLRDGTVFMTNIMHYRSRALTLFDFIVPSGTVVRYRDGEWSVFDRWYRGSNGIAVVEFDDPDKQDLLHVAEFHDKRIHTLRLDAEHNFAGIENIVATPHRPDNLLIGRERNPQLWIGSHPNILTIARHLASADQPAPTDVTTVDALKPSQASVQQRYFFNGPTPNAGATAIQIDDWLYIGQVADSGLVACGPGDQELK